MKNIYVVNDVNTAEDQAKLGRVWGECWILIFLSQEAKIQHINLTSQENSTGAYYLDMTPKTT